MPDMKTLSDGNKMYTVFDEKAVRKTDENKLAEDLNLGSHKITELADPVADTDAANKKYVDIKSTMDDIREYTKTLFKNGNDLNIEDVLNVDVLSGNSPSFSIVAKEDASSVSGLPATIKNDGINQFYAYRLVLPIKASNGTGPEFHNIVILFEMYPKPGRIWETVYNRDAQTWSSWYKFEGTVDE